MRISLQRSLLLAALVCGTTAGATPAGPMNVVIQGNQCVGLDCVSSEIFADSTLKLKENNTRIRFWDIDLPNPDADNPPPASWALVANDSANGGSDYMGVTFISSDPQLSDGTAIQYDCSAGTPGTAVYQTSGGLPVIVDGQLVYVTIPEGEPVTDNNCQPIKATRTMLRFNTSLDRGVALGQDSISEPGNVSVGTTTTLRRLVHVSKALQGTDALVKAQLDAGVYGDYKARLAALNDQLDTLDTQVSQLEATAAQRSAPADTNNGGSLTPLLLLVLLGAGLLRWKPIRR